MNEEVSTAMRIRTAAATDAQVIAGLCAQLGYPYPTEKLRGNVDRILRDNDQRLFVAEDSSGHVWGVVHASVYQPVFSEKMVNILGIVVDEDHRDQGIGKMLLRETEAWAREISCAAIRANSSTERTMAHLFYEGNGFTEKKQQYRFLKSLSSRNPKMTKELET